ncbi:unnamed protein product [Bursaphelenchus okinawaensis]|uniref:GST C-terminal domain-containing protein n=1 Tax=Bursaphelenchus okinawaensis TaxID=465554 RepID=A0A811LDL4_9BILA|nr:unnamed protein product [Bursaphelenchus okinawaensis]CAG9122294.1 unnamed protein product [Bursaphelenchus okinawaensis]
MSLASVAQFYIEQPETSKEARTQRSLDFSAPQFVLLEGTDDPFDGIIQKMFEYGQCFYEKVEVTKNEQLTSQGVEITKLPALQFDGLTLTGFSTVCRAIATRVGLDGCSVKESNEIDMIVNFIEAEMNKLRPLIQRWTVEQESDDESDDDNDTNENEFTFQLAPILDARFKTNGSKTVVGKSITWADFVLVYFMRTLIEFTGTQILDDYPDLAYYYHKNHAL